MIRLMDDRIFIEGFKEIVSIEKEMVSILFKEYKLVLEGEELQVVAFSKSEMILFGKILCVSFHYHDV